MIYNTTAVIASQRVGAKRRPMTGSAKQSRGHEESLNCFVAFAPRNDGRDDHRRHSGARRSLEPGISRFRIGPLRGPSGTTENTAVLARSASDEAIQGVILGPGLLRGACHPGALRADRLPRNDEKKTTAVIPGRAQREPGISRHNLEIPDRSAFRGPSGMTIRNNKEETI
jgi:hypothetical protein